MNKIYREAFSEVDAIFNLMPLTLLNKIPEKFKQIIKEEKSIDYKPEITEPIENFVLKEETIIILGLIYRNFLCSSEEKERLKNRDAQKIKEVENELREKYNPDNIFKETKNNNIIKNIEPEKVIEEKIVTETSMVVVEEKWYKKIFNMIKKFFKK